LEQGLSFGGGSLQHFGINSNTSANGFIRGLYKKAFKPNQPQSPAPAPKLAASGSNNALTDLKNVGLDEGSDEEEDVQKNDDYVALPPFRDLYKLSPLIQLAFEFGPQVIPLSAVGMIFNYAGNHLLSYIWQQHKKKVFYPLHQVQSIQMLPNGEIVTTALRREVEIKVTEGNQGGGGTGKF
jgi:hypothetical protein